MAEKYAKQQKSAVSSDWKICRRMSVSINRPGNFDFWPFELETVASKVGNLHSEFGHTRPSGSRVIRYVRDGQTDRRTDRRTDARTNKSKAYCPFPTGGGIIKNTIAKKNRRYLFLCCSTHVSFADGLKTMFKKLDNTCTKANASGIMFYTLFVAGQAALAT